GRGLVVAGNERTARDAARDRAGAGTLGNGVQKPGGAAGGSGGVGIFGDFDVPGALADGDAGKRCLILRLEPALRVNCMRRGEERQQPGAEDRKSWQRNLKSSGHVQSLLGSTFFLGDADPSSI